MSAEGDTVWRWSDGQGFIQMTGAETLAPGKTLEYGEAYDSELAPGRYEVIGTLVSLERPLSASASIVRR